MEFRRAWRSCEVARAPAGGRWAGLRSCGKELGSCGREVGGIAKLRERAGQLWEGVWRSLEAGGEELRESPSGTTPSYRNSEIRICSFHISYSHDLWPSRCMHFLHEEFVDTLLQKRLGTCRHLLCASPNQNSPLHHISAMFELRLS